MVSWTGALVVAGVSGTVPPGNLGTWYLVAAAARPVVVAAVVQAGMMALCSVLA